MTDAAAAVLVPFIDDRFHPHRDRLNQWMYALSASHSRVFVLALSAAHIDLPGVTLITAPHPRLEHRILIAKTAQHQRAVTERLRMILITLQMHERLNTIVAMHPMLLPMCCNATGDTRVVLDVHDTARLARPVHSARWGHLTLAVLSDAEASRARRLWRDAQICVVPLLPHAFIEPVLDNPFALSFWGRASRDSFCDLLTAIDIARRSGALGNVGIRICGEVGRSVRSTANIAVIPPTGDLAMTIHGTVPLIPCPENRSGVSSRLIDAFAAGCFALLGDGVARGTDCRPGVHYFRVKYAEDVRRAIELAIHDPQKAVAIASAAQTWLRKRKEEFGNAMSGVVRIDP